MRELKFGPSTDADDEDDIDISVPGCTQPDLPEWYRMMHPEFFRTSPPKQYKPTRTAPYSGYNPSAHPCPSNTQLDFWQEICIDLDDFSAYAMQSIPDKQRKRQSEKARVERNAPPKTRREARNADKATFEERPEKEHREKERYKWQIPKDRRMNEFTSLDTEDPLQHVPARDCEVMEREWWEMAEEDEDEDKEMQLTNRPKVKELIPVDRDQDLVYIVEYDGHKEHVELCLEKQALCTCSWVSKTGECHFGAFPDVDAFLH